MKTFFDTDLLSRTWMSARGLMSLIVLGGMAQVAAAQGDAQSQSQPAPVGVIALETQDVPFVLTVPGRAVAYRESDIRPQVTGVIDEINYTPGEEVSAGELMFQI